MSMSLNEVAKLD